MKYDRKRKLHVVRKFVKEHNHQMAIQMEVRFLLARGNVLNIDNDHARAMHGLGLGLAKQSRCLCYKRVVMKMFRLPNKICAISCTW